MDVSRAVSEGYKVWFALGAVLLTVLWPYVWQRHRLAARAVLVALALLATANYMRWGLKSTFERIDTYDLVHYYLNAKYFDELGYLDLYPACILADIENGGPFFDQGDQYMAQLADEGHVIKPISHALARGRAVRAERFTDARWEAFQHDFLHLQRKTWLGWDQRRGNKTHQVGSKLYREMIQDHGFNGTPVWVVLAEPFANAIAVENIKWLGYLDLIALIAGLVLIGWAYSAETALFVLTWMCLTYSMRWPTIGWAFLRYDWVFGLMAATALLKKGYPFIGGIAAGYTSTLRLFPALWMWGPFMRGVAELFERKVNRRMLTIAAGFLLAVGTLQAVAVLRVGTGTVVEHIDNMLDHNDAEKLSSRRIGFALALVYPDRTVAREGADRFTEPKFLSNALRTQIAELQPVRYALGLLLMIALGWALRKQDDDESFAFGMIPFFLLTTASYYYYIARITLVIAHAGRLGEARHRVGLAMLFGVELLSNWIETNYPGQRFFLIGTLAWGITLYFLVQLFWLLFTPPASSTQASVPADEPAA